MYKPLGLRAEPLPHRQATFCPSAESWGQVDVFPKATRGQSQRVGYLGAGFLLQRPTFRRPPSFAFDGFRLPKPLPHSTFPPEDPLRFDPNLHPSLTENKANHGRATKAHQAAHPSPTSFRINSVLALACGESHDLGRSNRLPTYKPLGLRAGPLPHRQVSFCLSAQVWGQVDVFPLAAGASPRCSATPPRAAPSLLPLPPPV